MISARVDGEERLVSVGDTPIERLTVVVQGGHTTTHLPPDRAVITTPALVALMEQCIAASEARHTADGGRWRSMAANVKHRAGAKIGENLEVEAARAVDSRANRATWTVSVTAADGRLIAEGTVERIRAGACHA